MVPWKKEKRVNLANQPAHQRNDKSALSIASWWWRTMKIPAGMPGNPQPDGGCFVGCVIVQDHVNVQFSGRFSFQLLEEA